MFSCFNPHSDFNLIYILYANSRGKANNKKEIPLKFKWLQFGWTSKTSPLFVKLSLKNVSEPLVYPNCLLI